MSITNQQIENIQIDYGIIYANYGETDQNQLGPTRGGSTFTATKTLRDIEYDGSKGKTKGMQVIDDITAMLSVSNLNISMESLALALPFAEYDEANGKITCKSANVGVIPNSAYLKNITMFAKTIKGEFKKITLYNAMTENDFSLAAVPKEEGIVAMEVYAHWDPTDDTKNLFEVEDVESIA